MYQSSINANRHAGKFIISLRRGFLLSVCFAGLFSLVTMPAWSAEESLKEGGLESSATLPLPPTIDAGEPTSVLGKSGGVAIKPPEAADPMAGVSESSDALDALAWPDQPKDDKNTPPPVGATGTAAVVPATTAQPPAELPIETPPSAQPAPAAAPVAATGTEQPPIPSAVSDVKPAVTAQMPEAAPLLSEVSSLEKRLTALEKRLESFEAKITEGGKGAAMKQTEVSPVEKTSPSPVKKKKKMPPRKRWVLKSAKPGEAWVAEVGSSEMQVVSVGQVLNGVGRVTAIEQDDAGRWVVTGTRGKVAQ